MIPAKFTFLAWSSLFLYTGSLRETRDIEDLPSKAASLDIHVPVLGFWAAGENNAINGWIQVWREDVNFRRRRMRYRSDVIIWFSELSSPFSVVFVLPLTIPGRGISVSLLLEEEALLSEMNVTGQAFEDMKEQNIHLMQQLWEKDYANFKLM
ncbi:hypothetical protein DUI87_25667 [Hirundo rustica rustica]|uniref:E3 ubiquitin protein ligase n=1 Tax=Hirundo rustica rustica TaxID=333673 RepID=A0A3M0JC20_HIRRU|nr:hypothetical protein DUI87_25667 [Hirundo rustica rustica]